MSDEKNRIEELFECIRCPYTVTKERKYGYTLHCKIEPTLMDVTHVKGRSSLCPLLQDR